MGGGSCPGPRPRTTDSGLLATGPSPAPPQWERQGQSCWPWKLKAPLAPCPLISCGSFSCPTVQEQPWGPPFGLPSYGAPPADFFYSPAPPSPHYPPPPTSAQAPAACMASPRGIHRHLKLAPKNSSSLPKPLLPSFPSDVNSAWPSAEMGPCPHLATGQAPCTFPRPGTSSKMQTPQVIPDPEPLLPVPFRCPCASRGDTVPSSRGSGAPKPAQGGGRKASSHTPSRSWDSQRPPFSACLGRDRSWSWGPAPPQSPGAGATRPGLGSRSSSGHSPQQSLSTVSKRRRTVDLGPERGSAQERRPFVTLGSSW